MCSKCSWSLVQGNNPRKADVQGRPGSRERAELKRLYGHGCWEGAQNRPGPLVESNLDVRTVFEMHGVYEAHLAVVQS